MAASELTVTPANPSPPTNMSSTGTTAPNPPNYTKNTYGDPKNWSATNPKDFPPPFYDDGTAGSLTAIAANTAALASGSGATAGGTEGTYPGTVNGVVPASTSVANEGTGTVVVVTAPGSRTEAPTQSLSTGPVLTPGTLPNPNALHASTQAPAVAPTITGLLPAAPVSGAGQLTLTVNGTGFRPDSKITVAGLTRNDTVYVSATQLKLMLVDKRATAGNIAIAVTTGGTAIAATNWVFS